MKNLIGLTTAGFVIIGLSACGGGASAAPATPDTTATVSGTVTPSPALVGLPESFALTVSAPSRAIPNLTFDVNSDMSNHHTIDGVTAVVASGSPVAFADRTCSDSGNGNFTCGSLPMGSSIVVTFSATPKDAGNFAPGVQTFTDTMGASDWQAISAGDLSWKEAVDAA